jgi:hypothetical protein
VSAEGRSAKSIGQFQTETLPKIFEDVGVSAGDANE